MDASGRVSGDRGYDPSTEQGYSGSGVDPSGRVYGDVGYNPNPNLGGVSREPKELSQSEQWRKDHPAQPMAPVDFTNAPGWWGKGGESNNPTPAPAPPQLPSGGSATSSPLMLNILGDTGGRTGLVGQRALSNALRSGGQ